MTFVLKTLKGIRSHWKKSIFFSVAAAYGINYVTDTIKSNQLMRVYCKEALKYGQEPIPVLQQPRKVTVILNPNANKRKAKAHFEKYSAPLLHLAGIRVEILMTESEGHAKSILENLISTEAIIIAGGDGTVSEVITGLLRRCGNDASKNHCPIGVLPLGQSNTLALSLFPGGENLNEVRSIADATMAVITQCTKALDLMKIEIMESAEQETKPVYAIGGIEWGVFRDAKAVKDNYWYFGGLRHYATYIFNGSNTSNNCEAIVSYSLPCSGCTNCVDNTTINQRWWQKLLRWNAASKSGSKKENPQCREFIEKEISATSIVLQTTNTLTNLETDIPHLRIGVGPDKLDYFDFVQQGWSKNTTLSESVNARQVQIMPSANVSATSELSIDSENFELKPINVTLLPKAIQVFSKKEDKSDDHNSLMK